MVVSSTLLVNPAIDAGIKVPSNLDNFNPADYPRFNLFRCAQLSQPMPYPNVVWDNAKVIARVPEEKIKNITFEELIELGFKIGFSK